MEDGTRLTAVGDDAQSIYGFRGSQAGAMARLIQDRRLTSDQTYGLTLNHRSACGFSWLLRLLWLREVLTAHTRGSVCGTEVAMLHNNCIQNINHKT